MASKYLIVTIPKTGVSVQVAESDGTPIMTDIGEAELRGGAVTLERIAAPEARFFGLGAREDAAVELRGTRTTAVKPFLISSAGYGEFHQAPGEYTFDLASTRPDRYRIEAHGADRVDYYFFYGPTPKDILEQYLLVNGPGEQLGLEKFRLLTRPEVPTAASVLKTRTVSGTIHSLINGGLSGELLPAMPLDDYPTDDESVRRQAIQLGSVAPIVFGSRPDAMHGTWRELLTDYFNVYAAEARSRGLPLIRALAMHYPKDAEAAKVSDEFMLGDELLVAPIYGIGSSRSVYLPMGLWTRLSDNQVFPGKGVITIEAHGSELPLFSRNGAVVPVGSNPMSLHYFPRLGGEFFLFENDLEEYSQVHAAPAGDFLRLEIESHKDRAYEWVVHHIDRPKSVEGFAEVRSAGLLRAGSWFYDVRNRNLHVRTLTRAGEDRIINVSF